MNQTSNPTPINVLLVEDSPSDQELTREAFESARVLNELHVVGDGDEAMEFLYKRGPFSNAPRPDIVLLDLNLPRMDGREVLAEIKADESLRTIPVVILTTSDDEHDVLSSYGLNANCYLTKPVGFENFMDVLRVLEQFWLVLVRLPPA